RSELSHLTYCVDYCSHTASSGTHHHPHIHDPTNFHALTATSVPHNTLTFPYTTLIPTQVIDVTINGTNDGATISGTAAGTVTEDGNGATTFQTASGTLSVSDVDSGENHFQAVAAAALTGTYGSCTFNSATCAWGYTLNNGATNVQALTATSVVHDTLTVTSPTRRSSDLIDVTINGTNDGATISGTAAGTVT